MRFTINLASHKYADARQFYLRWGGAVILLLMLTVLLGMKARYSYLSARQSGRHIAETREKIRVKEQQREKAEAVLNQPENHDVREQLSFWKEPFKQKSFSWTELFTELEKMMPGRLYVASITPALTTDNRLQLKMIVVGEKADDGNELIRRMEKSERFRFPIIVDQSPMQGQSQGQSKGPPLTQFGISTYYTPANRTQPAPAAGKEGMQ